MSGFYTMVCFFTCPHFPQSSCTYLSSTHTGNSFLHQEYFSTNTANSKVFLNNHHLFNIHKYSISKLLSFTRGRATNTGTTVAAIMLALWVIVYEHELVDNR